MHCPEQGACVLEQRVLLEGEDAMPLIHCALQLAGEPPQPLAVVHVPLGVLLSRGLQLSVDGRAPQSFAFHHCRPEGCLALFPLADDLRGQLEQGREAQVRFHLVDGRLVGVPLSLLGFTAGLKALNLSVGYKQHP